MGCLSAKSDTNAEQTLSPNNPPEKVFEDEVKESVPQTNVKVEAEKTPVQPAVTETKVRLNQ
jgi:hypothetical protein